MSSFRRISRELKSCISNNSFLKLFTGFEGIIVFASLAILFLNTLSGFGTGLADCLKPSLFGALC